MASFKIKRTTDITLVEELDAQCFDYTEDDPVETDNTQWWLVFCDGKPVAYAGAKFVASENIVYLSRVGVLEDFRGNGLQARLIRVRVRWAQEIEAEQVVTYTINSNTPSCNNLIKTGFLTYRPAYKWAGLTPIYWVKKLTRSK